MTGVAAYVVLVVVLPALLLGHQGQDFPLPLRGAWRRLCARLAAEVPERAPGLLRTPDRAAESRLRLRSARVPRSEPTATAPPQPHSPRWSASQGVGGGFHAPAPASRSQRRSAPSWANTQPINEEAA